MASMLYGSRLRERSSHSSAATTGGGGGDGSEFGTSPGRLVPLAAAEAAASRRATSSSMAMRPSSATAVVANIGPRKRESSVAKGNESIASADDTTMASTPSRSRPSAGGSSSRGSPSMSHACPPSNCRARQAGAPAALSDSPAPGGAEASTDAFGA